jgi:hypothetical protein
MTLGAVGFAVGVSIAIAVGRRRLRLGRRARVDLRTGATVAHPRRRLRRRPVTSSAPATPIAETLAQILGFGPDPWQVGAAYDQLDVGALLAEGRDPIAELAREFGCTQRRIVSILRSGLPSATR